MSVLRPKIKIRWLDFTTQHNSAMPGPLTLRHKGISYLILSVYAHRSPRFHPLQAGPKANTGTHSTSAIHGQTRHGALASPGYNRKRCSTRCWDINNDRSPPRPTQG